MSRILRAVTKDGSARAIVMDSKDIVNRAMEIHKPSATAAAALGRTLTAASLMGSLLGEPEDLLTLRFKGDGGGGTVLASSDYKGNVRGFISNPLFDCPVRASDGKLDVAKCVGKGYLNVLRDAGGAEPYSGVCPIVSGEIAEDIAYYYATSEQVPTLCALGVLVDTDYTCKSAGGVLIQLLPFPDDSVSARLEANAASAPSVTSILSERGPEALLEIFLSGIEYELFDAFDCGYVCPCSRTRTDRALLALGESELKDMIDAPEEEFTVRCQFCDRVYRYSKQDLRDLLKGGLH
ncbi:MAG: Hsp33 family molecular chaperone HslO [Clostridia bacterium]|nr:Hsp33 family molecular chaperone HslO [Clostridia bacterium]